MRLPPALLSLIFLVTSQNHHVSAGPFPRDNSHEFNGYGYLANRGDDCFLHCGYGGKYCCTEGQVCYTDSADKALCGMQTAYATAAAGWAYYTTTYSMTDLVVRTSTFSSWVGVAAATSAYLPQSTAICYAPTTSCGAICCASDQYCYTSGMCKQKSGASDTIPASYLTPVVTQTTAAAGTGTATSFSAPLRGTSASTTTTVAVTTTQGFLAPVATTSGSISLTQTSSGGGLSGGAIAGIVIGVLAGILILIAICFCCILKAGWDTIMGIFGLGRKRRTERTEVIESRYSRSGSAVVRDTHRGWFGGRRSGSRVVVDEKRSGRRNEAGTLAGIAVGLAGLWALLGLRRKSKARDNASDVSYDSYTETYTGTSESSLSSDDRRTRTTRR